MVGSNTRRSGRMSWRGMALAVLAGCTPSALPTVALDAEPVETHFLIDEVSRTQTGRKATTCDLCKNPGHESEPRRIYAHPHDAALRAVSREAL